MCHGCEPVKRLQRKSPTAKANPKYIKASIPKIIRVLVSAPAFAQPLGAAGASANRKRVISPVKHSEIVDCAGELGRSADDLQRYSPGIWSVQRNSHMASALIAMETVKSDTSIIVNLGGPLPVSSRNIQGSRIMA